VRLYLKNTHHKKELVEWLKVKAQSSSSSTANNNNNRIIELEKAILKCI
jgi:hypothetical protein